MRIDEDLRGPLATRFEVLLPHLDERQQRMALGAEARLLGHGGVAAVAAAARVSPTTVRRGVTELDSGEEPLPVGRVRRSGGGRKSVTAHDPELVAALLELVEPNARGDPMSPLRWTTKSLRHLADELTGQGHPVSAPTVGHLLRENGFSLQGTAKTLEGKQHPDRDAQFACIDEQVKAHQSAGAGSTGLLSDADRILITVVYQRQLCSMNVLSDLLGVNANSIGQAIADTRALLAEHGRTTTASTLRFATADALTEFTSGSRPDLARPRLAERLAAPALTGMTRADLAALTGRVVPVLAARAERHRQRGGERLPGARGGIFMQKITDEERVLATVLYRRGMGTHDTFAELFEVSRPTIGGALREVGPLLEQNGYVATPAAARFTTAAELLASLPVSSADDTDTPTS